MRVASSESFSAAVSAVLALLRSALQPPHAQLLLPAQVMLLHDAPALCDTLASSPRAASAGRPACVAQLLLERQAPGYA